MPRKILNWRYHIIHRLGSGGFSETYLAQDRWQKGNFKCVVKQLKPDKIDPVTLSLFEQEAQVLYNLGKHAQIPELLAHFQQEQAFYLVQEFIEGYDLSKEIRTGQRWGETKVIKLVQDILEILVFVHENKVIHRDIKPANIMRRKDGKIVLIDFGGVKQIKAPSDSTILTPPVATPGYAPLEQFHNKAQLSSDIYAVGILAIQALTGLQPLQLQRDTKTFQLLWRNETQVSQKVANFLDKMVQVQYTERYQSAAEALDALVHLLDPASTWLNRGYELVELQAYEEGVAAYDKAIKIKQNDSKAWYNRGVALHNLGQYEGAIASYDQAIQIKRDYPDAWNNRGVALEKQGRYDDAIASYDQALQIKRDYPDAWHNRGVALRNLGRNFEAITSYDQAIQIKRDYPDAWNNRGVALEKLGQYEEAIASYDQAIQIKSDYPDAWNNRGVALRNLGRYDEAITSYDQAIQIKRDFHDAWNNRGVALEKLGRYDEAITSYDQAIQIKSDYPDAWNNRGVALYNLELYEEAISSYDQALVIRPNYQLAIENRKLAQSKLQFWQKLQF